jgi:hypothetical protein
VETLCTIWVTTNEDLCVEWQVQLAKDKWVSSERIQLAEEENEHLCIALYLKEATTKVEEWKKNHSKHLVIPIHPRPLTNDEETLVSDFTMHKLDKGLYMELPSGSWP